jgi:Zn-dependent peptidase ImmA (M78 family)
MGREKQPPVREITPSEIRRFVRLIRRILRIDDQRAPNILLIFERLKKIFPRLRIRIVEDSELGKAEAQAYPTYWIVKLRRGVYEGLLRGDTGARWTLAHELGHVLLRHPGKPHRRRVASNFNEIERQAHIFAAQLLAPSHLVERYKSPAAIATAFQLSLEAAKRRFCEVMTEKHGKLVGNATATVSDARERTDLDDLASDICSAISSVISEVLSGEAPVEPLNDNLFTTSMLVTTASNLLLDAFVSVRPDNVTNRFVRAACVATAVVTIRPIREIGAPTSFSNRLPAINQLCGLASAAALLDMPFRVSQTLDGDLPAPVALPVTGFLSALVNYFEDKVATPSEILHFSDMPTYNEYNETNDISWPEIHLVAQLARLLELWTSREFIRDSSPAWGEP